MYQMGHQNVCYDKQQCDNDSFEENMKALINTTQLDEEYLEFAVSQGVFNVNSMLYGSELSYLKQEYDNVTPFEPALYRNSGIPHIAQDIAIDLNVTNFNIESGSVENIGEHPSSSQKTRVLYSNNHHGSFYNMEIFPNVHKNDDPMNNFRLHGVENLIASYEDHVAQPIIYKENKNPAITFLSGMMPHMTDNEFESSNVFCFSQKQKNHDINNTIFKDSRTQDYGIRRVGNETPISNVERSRIENEMVTKIPSEYDICVGESQRDQYLTLKNIHTPNNYNVSIYDSSLHNEDVQKRRNSDKKCHDFTKASTDPKLQRNDNIVLKVGKESAAKEILFPRTFGDIEEISRPSDDCSLKLHDSKNGSAYENKFFNLSRLKQKNEVHSDERLVTSDISTKQVKPMCNLNKSMLIKRFTCNVCHKAFFFKWNLVVHMRIHSGDQQFTCDICHKAFSYKSNLMTHIRTHRRDDKPFTCNICHKAYFYKSNLVAHAHTHSGDKAFSCDIRKKGF